MLAPWL